MADRAERRRAARADRKAQWAKEHDEHAVEREWEIDPQWQSYQTHVRTELVPKLADSTLTVSIVPTDPADVDIKFAVELGLYDVRGPPLPRDGHRHRHRMAPAVLRDRR
jgi:hypothetical protein